MRKISGGQISSFFSMLGLAVALGALTTVLAVHKSWAGDFYSVVFVVSLIVLTYAWAILVYRIFLHFFPLQMGPLPPGSRGEFIAQVNALFYLILFNSLICPKILPIPLKTLIISLLGAQIGKNSFSPGTVLDPPLTSMGNNSIIGHGATVYAHAIEGGNFALYRVELGDNVTIGAHAIIMPGVVVGDGAIVSSGAVVRKDTRIGPGECWGGVPAKYLGPAAGAEA